MALQNFINTNYLEPLCRFYTPVGTITYGILLVIAVYGTYRLLEKLNVKINKKFLIAILPFIIYGGWTRALRDYSLGIYQSKLFCSPPIYFFIFAVTLFSLLLAIFVERKLKIKYYNTMLFIGILFLIYNLTLTTINNLFGFGLILLLTGIFSFTFYLIHRIKPRLLSLENAGIISAHLLDASSTFTALTFFQFYEQHVLPTFLINIFGPWIMFPLKIIVVWPVLYVLDKESKDVFFKNFLKITILILGLALGFRDFLTISMLS